MKKETEHQQILALADNDGIARVFPVNMEQVKAAFAAVGGAAFEEAGPKRLVFYVAGREDDLAGTIGESAYKIEQVAEAIGGMAVTLQTDPRRQEETCHAMRALMDVIKERTESSIPFLVLWYTPCGKRGKAASPE